MKEKNKEYALDILKEISEVVSHVDESKLEQLTDLILEIKKAGKKVYCAGAGRSLLMIRTFSMRLMHLGLRSYVVGETATPALEAGDLLIFGSGSGETGSLCAIQERQRRQERGLQRLLEIRVLPWLAAQSWWCIFRWNMQRTAFSLLVPYSSRRC